MESSATTCSIAPATRTAPPVALIIKGPRQQYGFSYDDLQAWPDSMLARAVVDTATAPDKRVRHAVGTSPAPVVWQLQSMPKCPLTAWPEAAAVVYSLYRHHYITPDIMTTVLEGVVGKAAQHYEGTYQRLAELLAYLNLPGPVSRWLPPINLVRISHFNVLTFLSNHKELECDCKIKILAEHAVTKMLSYQPYENAEGTSANSTDNSMRLAAFAIAYKGLDEPLRVYAVDDARYRLASTYGTWLEGLKAGRYSEADGLPWDRCSGSSLWDVRGRDLQFAELTHGTSAPLSTAEVGVHQLVGTVHTGTTHQLLGHITAAFDRLAGGTALTLFDWTVQLVYDTPCDDTSRRQLGYRKSSKRHDICLWTILW